jgi:hypothetical protein
MKLLHLKYSLATAICAVAMVTSVRSLAQDCDSPDMPMASGNFRFLVTDSGKRFCLARPESGDIVKPVARPKLLDKGRTDGAMGSRCLWTFEKVGFTNEWHVMSSGLAWTADVDNSRLTLEPLMTPARDTQSWRWIKGVYGVGLAVKVNGESYYLRNLQEGIVLSNMPTYGWCTERIDNDVRGE